MAFPTIYVVSDSIGVTAQSVARAAAAQFGEPDPHIVTLPKAQDFAEIRSFLEDQREKSSLGSAPHVREDGSIVPEMLVFYTLVDRAIARELVDWAREQGWLYALDLMTPALTAISAVTREEPLEAPGALHVANSEYFKRIDALQFAINHDDGRNPQDLAKADIVLIGVSRSGKTPLSIYLAEQGYRVANVPLDLHSEPPKELASVDSRRLFGLVTSPELLVEIRERRIAGAATVASDYADPESVFQDLEEARRFMRSLGCIVISTEHRAVEENAAEILRYYRASFEN